MDRAFTLTGGTCEVLREKSRGADIDMDMGKAQQFVTSMACKAVGGTWKGGHDISGHVFMLVLGSMFLSMEVLHVIFKAMKWEEERITVEVNGTLRSADDGKGETEKDIADGERVWNVWAKVALGVAGLSVWMLLMTAAYFHTWFEKVTSFTINRYSLKLFTNMYLVQRPPRRPHWYFRGILPTPGDTNHESHHRNARHIIQAFYPTVSTQSSGKEFLDEAINTR